jgi:hypothetical protein
LDTDYSNLASKCAEESWIIITQNNPSLENIKLTAHAPDITCKFHRPNSQVISTRKIELKSSTGSRMPGSTISSLDINQPIIYCKRPQKGSIIYEIRYGLYHDALAKKNSDTELFQDRTPRPSIHFDNLPSVDDESRTEYVNKEKEAWIPYYAKCALNRMKLCGDEHTQGRWKDSWQDDLTKYIIYYAISDITSMEELVALRESVRPTYITLSTELLRNPK